MPDVPHPIRVVLCDDAEAFRALVRVWLEADPVIEVVGEAGDGEAGVAAAEGLRPDVLLLDISMPRLDGLDALPRLRSVAPETAVIGFSSQAAARMAAPMLDRGAVAYLEKGAGPDEVRAAVYAAAHRAA